MKRDLSFFGAGALCGALAVIVALLRCGSGYSSRAPTVKGPVKVIYKHDTVITLKERVFNNTRYIEPVYMTRDTNLIRVDTVYSVETLQIPLSFRRVEKGNGYLDVTVTQDTIDSGRIYTRASLMHYSVADYSNYVLFIDKDNRSKLKVWTPWRWGAELGMIASPRFSERWVLSSTGVNISPGAQIWLEKGRMSLRGFVDLNSVKVGAFWRMK